MFRDELIETLKIYNLESWQIERATKQEASCEDGLSPSWWDK